MLFLRMMLILKQVRKFSRQYKILPRPVYEYALLLQRAFNSTLACGVTTRQQICTACWYRRDYCPEQTVSNFCSFTTFFVRGCRLWSMAARLWAPLSDSI